MTEFKRISYDAVQVGEELESTDLVVKPEDIDTFAYAVDDHHPWYFEDSPFGGAIAPPTLLANQALPVAPPSHKLASTPSFPRRIVSTSAASATLSSSRVAWL